MERWPVIITIGGGLLGFVAGEMLVTDPALKGWLTGLGVGSTASKPKVGGLSLEILVRRGRRGHRGRRRNVARQAQGDEGRSARSSGRDRRPKS